jgi:hypothetical protein
MGLVNILEFSSSERLLSVGTWYSSGNTDIIAPSAQLAGDTIWNAISSLKSAVKESSGPWSYGLTRFLKLVTTNFIMTP